VADRFTFTGQSTLGYFSYADTDTGRMLVADPGGTYGIRATEAGLAVPPPDGRWTGAQAPASPSSLPSTAPPKPPVTVPASTEGNEA
jgi:hypothetical protein